MGWMEVVPYIFGFMALSIATWIGKSLGSLGRSISVMKDSMGELNVNVAVVIEKVSNHEKRIERLEDGRGD